MDAPAAKRARVDDAAVESSTNSKAKPWSVDSWRSLPIKQQPNYPDPTKLIDVVSQISTRPPLVYHGEIDTLRKRLAEASAGKRFILQGGACAETFAECTPENIENTLKIMLQMSLILVHNGNMPVTRIMRMGGQYAKPRSKDTETINGKEYPSYRGDIVNSFSLDDRVPDPERLLQAYNCSSSTVNYIRALSSGGFASLHQASQWILDGIPNAQARQRYEVAVKDVTDSLRFMETVLGEQGSNVVNQATFYTSHEGLLLEYESALTREIRDGKFYNLSAHFLWIGDRTRQLDHAHIEYFRGIENPIGIKVGPSMANDELDRVLRILNPDNIPGKVTLITRYGNAKIASMLPGHIQAVQKGGHRVVWQADPMHGNTESTADGTKTRRFENILGELQQAFAIHKNNGSKLNGVHFELTGDANVTECMGGVVGLQASDLGRNYKSQCDPRLNYEQSLEMAFRMNECAPSEPASPRAPAAA